MGLLQRPDPVALMVEQIGMTPDIDRLRRINSQFAGMDGSTLEAIVEEAARFGGDCLKPLNAGADREGCRLESGRVRTPPGFAAAWRSFVEGGWPTLDQPIEHGGQGLPLILAVAVQQLLDSGCMAFGMLPVLLRSAAKLIGVYGDEAMRREWLPKLVSGEWAATICISEPDAGSDISRIRTRAEPGANGRWLIHGEKMWISFGDHDLTDRIGHCLIAKTAGGVSLFLVPNRIEGAGGWVDNAIAVRRVEEKMGLHGSPTCALGFEGAEGWLIGSEGRGLAQLFVMIANMRLSAGVQGVAGAMSVAEVALDYALERRQGGSPHEPAVAIVEHVDVQRQLMSIIARVEVMRGLANMIAVQAELAQHEPDAQARETASALTQWLLPIFKTVGGETGVHSADHAIQILGGAGYTTEWPVEQVLRDSRVLTIYEGTTGIQALDLLHRRLWRDEGRGLSEFLRRARQDPLCTEPHRSQMNHCLDVLERAAEHLQNTKASVRVAEAGATAFLHLAGMATTGWIAARLASNKERSAAGRWLAACGRFWLVDLEARAAVAHTNVINAGESVEILGGIFGREL